MTEKHLYPLVNIRGLDKAQVLTALYNSHLSDVMPVLEKDQVQAMLDDTQRWVSKGYLSKEDSEKWAYLYDVPLHIEMDDLILKLHKHDAIYEVRKHDAIYDSLSGLFAILHLLEGKKIYLKREDWEVFRLHAKYEQVPCEIFVREESPQGGRSADWIEWDVSEKRYRRFFEPGESWMPRLSGMYPEWKEPKHTEETLQWYENWKKENKNNASE